MAIGFRRSGIMLVQIAVALAAFSAVACHGSVGAEANLNTPAPPPAAPDPAPTPAPEPPKVMAVGKVTLNGNKVNLPGEIEYRTGSAKIVKTPANSEILAELTGFLKQNERLTRLRVEGYTDSTGNRKQNLKLSNARAESVVAFLVARGVDRNRLHPIGYGPERPVADNGTADGRALNRRTEFHVEEIEGKSAEEQAPAAAPLPGGPG